jgi:choline kinase
MDTTPGGFVIGMVLAAGAGSRLGETTAALPKTLLPIDGDKTILDVALANFAHVGLQRAAIVTGFASERIEERVPELERRHGVELELVFNPKALEWNNVYSLWCARELFGQGVLLANGDTVHPPSVEERLLEARGDAQVVIAVDDQKELAVEEMKVHVDGDGRLERINKAIDPASAHGEYIGVTLIEPSGAEPLAEALEATWRRDPSLYYEDGFQELADRGGHVGIAPIGAVEWVEVDDHDDLAKARVLACRY